MRWRARGRVRSWSGPFAGDTRRPIAWLVLTHHHPDHHFGAVVLRKAGARVIAHPDKRVLASEGGEDALIADWVRVVGLDAMRGFEFADMPDRPVTRADTLRLGGRTIVISHPGAGHSRRRPDRVAAERARALRGRRAGRGWREDGGGRQCRRAAARAGHRVGVGPRCVVPGHGAIPARPADLIARTRVYITGLKARCAPRWRRACRCGGRWPTLPPPDATGRSRSTPAGGGTRCGSTWRRSGSTWDWRTVMRGVPVPGGLGRLAWCCWQRALLAARRRRRGQSPQTRSPASSDRAAGRVAGAGRRDADGHPDRRLHLSQGPSARRGVPQHRDAPRQRGRHSHPAARRRRPTRRCSRGWDCRSTGRS